jgi:hypothetical protein
MRHFTLRQSDLPLDPNFRKPQAPCALPPGGQALHGLTVSHVPPICGVPPAPPLLQSLRNDARRATPAGVGRKGCSKAASAPSGTRPSVLKKRPMKSHGEPVPKRPVVTRAGRTVPTKLFRDDDLTIRAVEGWGERYGMQR